MRIIGTESTVKFFSAEWFATRGLAILVALLIATLVTWISRLIRRRLDRRTEKATDEATLRKLRRQNTATHIVLNAFSAAVWFVAILYVLSKLGIDVGPLLAGAGILGVALGFGAQTLVRDGLSGFFISLEQQYYVGDSVDLQTTGGQVTGKVERLTLRVTTLRAFDGTLNTIPNGNILVTSNKTRGWGRAIVDVRLALDEDMDHIRHITDELFDELRKEEPFKSSLTSGPELLGVESLTDYAQVVRFVGETLPGHRSEIERVLRERITARFAEDGIRVPVSATATDKPPG